MKRETQPGWGKPRAHLKPIRRWRAAAAAAAAIGTAAPHGALRSGPSRGKPRCFRARRGNTDGMAHTGAAASPRRLAHAKGPWEPRVEARARTWSTGAGGSWEAPEQQGRSAGSTRSPLQWSSAASIIAGGPPEVPPGSAPAPALSWPSLLAPQVGLDGVGRSHRLDEADGRVLDPEGHVPARPGGERSGAHWHGHGRVSPWALPH